MSRLSCMKRDIRLLFCHNTELYGALDTLVDFYGRFVLSDRLHCVQSDIFAVYRDALFLEGLCQVGCGHRTEDAAFLCLGGDGQLKRDVLADPLYNNKVVTKLINNIMLDGPWR